MRIAAWIRVYLRRRSVSTPPSGVPIFSRGEHTQCVSRGSGGGEALSVKQDAVSVDAGPHDVSAGCGAWSVQRLSCETKVKKGPVRDAACTPRTRSSASAAAHTSVRGVVVKNPPPRSRMRFRPPRQRL